MVSSRSARRVQVPLEPGRTVAVRQEPSDERCALVRPSAGSGVDVADVAGAEGDGAAVVGRVGAVDVDGVADADGAPDAEGATDADGVADDGDTDGAPPAVADAAVGRDVFRAAPTVAGCVTEQPARHARTTGIQAVRRRAPLLVVSRKVVDMAFFRGVRRLGSTGALLGGYADLLRKPCRLAA